MSHAYKVMSLTPMAALAAVGVVLIGIGRALRAVDDNLAPLDNDT